MSLLQWANHFGLKTEAQLDRLTASFADLPHESREAVLNFQAEQLRKLKNRFDELDIPWETRIGISFYLGVRNYQDLMAALRRMDGTIELARENAATRKAIAAVKRRVRRGPAPKLLKTLEPLFPVMKDLKENEGLTWTQIAELLWTTKKIRVSKSYLCRLAPEIIA